MGGGAGTPVAAGSREPVGDHLDEEVLGGHQLAPGRQRLEREVVAAPGGRLAHRGAGAEQHQHVTGREVGCEHVEVGDRAPPLAGEVGGRDQPADRRPARPARRPGRWPAAAAGRGRRHRGPGCGWRCGSRPATRGTAAGWPVGEVDAEHRADPGRQAGLGELHRAVGAVAVGQREGVHLLLGGPLDQRVGVGGAVLQGVAGGHVEMDERVRHDTP